MTQTKDPVTVYVCGQISGLSEAVYYANFRAACELLKKHGFTPVNPLEIEAACGETCGSELTFDDGTYKHDWKCYMKYDIIRLLDCDAIFEQSNAHLSRGAQLELTIAKGLGKKVIYSPPFGESDELDWD